MSCNPGGSNRNSQAAIISVSPKTRIISRHEAAMQTKKEEENSTDCYWPIYPNLGQTDINIFMYKRMPIKTPADCMDRDLIAT